MPLYGSSRLGIWRANRNATDCGEQPDLITAQYTGHKRYELSDHLGNILALISDKKLEHNWTGGNEVDQWLPDVVEARDYYAFGGDIVGRSYNSTRDKGRYGFNGKEDDADINEGGQDYGMRIYDARLGRFASVDPLTAHYPWYTPYQFAGNKPLWATDLDGLEENSTSTFVKKPILILPKPTFAGIITIVDATSQAAHKTFKGNYAQLRKADATGAAIVNQLAGNRIGNAESNLSITMTGTRSQISKSWIGTDIKYFTQFSYTFQSNNVTEQGVFELESSSISASARIWDPAAFLLLNRVITGVIVTAMRVVGPVTEELVTLYRSISTAEAESIKNTGKLSLGTGMEVKQFWQTKDGLEAWNKTFMAGEYNLEITVPKSMVGKGKLFNTAVQVDEAIGSNATIEREMMDAANRAVRSMRITRNAPQ